MLAPPAGAGGREGEGEDVNVRIKDISQCPPVETKLVGLHVLDFAVRTAPIHIWPDSEGGITIHLWEAYAVTGNRGRLRVVPA